MVEEQMQIIAPFTTNPFSESAMSETPPVQALADPITATPTPPVAPVVATPETKASDIVPPVDYNAYLKEEFGFDSAEVAKEQINKWKEMKPFEEPTFANDESRKLFDAIKEGKKGEVLTFLAKQQALENLTTGDITDKTAPEIVKMGMRLKYPTLTEDQIQYKYNKQFATSPKPVIQENELDTDFDIRMQTWKQQVEDAKQDLLIEAATARPDLEKFKSDLQLPNIYGDRTDEVPPTPEELAANETIKKSHIQELGTVLKAFKGVDITVKNGEVEMPVSYTSSEAERTQMQTILADAIEKNDVNSFFGSRWFDKDGKPQTEQMTKDINWMLNGEKIAQKLANESAAQRMELKLKEDSNIQLGTQPQGTFQPSAPGEQPNGKMPEIMKW